MTELKINNQVYKVTDGTAHAIALLLDACGELVEEIPVEKTWEVIEYKSSQGIWYRHKKGDNPYTLYLLKNIESICNTGVHMNSKPEEYQIHAIRTKEGVVYRIGDTIETIYKTTAIKPHVIDSIEISDIIAGGVGFRTSDGVMTSITIAKKVGPVKPVLLVTEDGKDIMDPEQILYDLSTKDWCTRETKAKWFIHCKKEGIYKDRKAFSTPEARQEWTEYNKPILSQKEVIELINRVEASSAGMLHVQQFKSDVHQKMDIYVMDKLNRQKV